MKPLRTIFFTWLAWVFLVIGFQAWATARLVPVYPDRAQQWTTQFTGAGYQQGHIYLLEPFLNDQVAWDSEYYIATAIGGYDNPEIGLVGQGGHQVSRSYAFFPFYSVMIRLFMFPLSVFELNEIATAALAGVVVSALGTLLGMFALYDLTRESLGQNGALRAVFYLIIFPTGFFLVQVYTEGLFIGLAFTCLAMVKRNHWELAALFGIGAVLTRAVGAALVLPMGINWLRMGEFNELDVEWQQIILPGIPWRPVYHALLAFAPAIVFFLWKISNLGVSFDFVEQSYFGRHFLDFPGAFFNWFSALHDMLLGRNPQASAYYFTELLGLTLGLVTCGRCLKTHPELGWFSLAVFILSWASGPVQGIHRYILAAPAVFVTLSQWGENPIFDRAWTILSIMLMGFLSAMFAFNLWVA